MSRNESELSQVPNPGRRKFIMRGGLMGLGLALGGARTLSILNDLNNTWDSANTDTDNFYHENKELLDKLHFGTSFAPEQFGLEFPVKTDPLGYEKRQKEALRALDWLTDDKNGLGMKEIRLGIRWTNVMGGLNDETFSLEMYEPFIKLCMQKNIRITLNAGIKTFRSPEEHVPQKVLDTTPNPMPGAVIGPEDPLAIKAQKALTTLLATLTDGKYTPQELSNIVALQLENESFVDNAGNKKWSMSSEHVKNMIKTGRKYFPNADILLNSSEAENLSQIRQVFKELMDEDSSYIGKCVAGIDYYYEKPDTLHLPFIKHGFEPVTVSRFKNFITIDDFEKHVALARKMGIRTEITEGQMEKWLRVTMPEEKAQGFRFMISQIGKYTDRVFRIWGSERLAEKYLSHTLTDENWENVALIQKVNKVIS